eukprot:TRINITY_DN32647_c0_g1_i3.p1 TRINITY_DN32647_c0_g1~~TRINITY_DN32647_c0_g1_i3.p1  ORF type:complete len:394 (-),score=92.80 TRINITY_DN32647_c0_g1_i3:257-1417(-)
MGSKQDLQTLYQFIIDEVVTKVKPEFIQEGVDESVLLDLKQRWEAKIKASDVYTQKFSSKSGKVNLGSHSGAGGIHYPLQHPYMTSAVPQSHGQLPIHYHYLYARQAQQYAQQIAAMGVVAPPVQSQQPHQHNYHFQNSHQYQQLYQYYQQQYAQWQYQQQQQQQQQQHQQQLQLLHQQHQQQQQQHHQQQQQQLPQQQQEVLGVGVKRKEPEEGDENDYEDEGEEEEEEDEEEGGEGQHIDQAPRVEVQPVIFPLPGQDSIPQTDGQDDDISGLDGNVPQEPVLNQDDNGQAGENPEQGGGGVDLVKGEETTSEDEEVPVDARLDDVVVSDGEEGEEEDAKNYVMAQYDKVSRTKNRWKAVLLNGIIHMDGKDYLFKKANGEFEF